jgi:hypothetical protein
MTIKLAPVSAPIFEEMRKYDEHSAYAQFGGCEAFHRLVAAGKINMAQLVTGPEIMGKAPLMEFISPKFLDAVRIR